jgi:hypothetical protein
MQEKIKKPPLNTPEYTAYVNRLMIQLYEQSQKNKEIEKIYYPVSYCEKELAKQFKARWCKDQKSWYFTSNEDLEDFINYE